MYALMHFTDFSFLFVYPYPQSPAAYSLFQLNADPTTLNSVFLDSVWVEPLLSMIAIIIRLIVIISYW
jgi:hypothetical protein